MKITKCTIKNAIISVSNKENIVKLAQGLLKNKINIFATENTAQKLKQNNIPVNYISDITKYPEMMNGQIKTIHPKIFGGILGDTKKDSNIIKKYNITIIDLVIINCYPINNNNTSINIDIGGPAMIRAAAKNYKNTVVIIDISDYDNILHEINNYGYVRKHIRLKLAIKAFEYINKYDFAIIKFLNKKKYTKNHTNSIFPNVLNLQYIKQQNLTYGENPHQKSAFYILKKYENITNCIESMKQLNGTKLSYNNIYDAHIAFECANQFQQPSCVIVKHGSPCGASLSSNILNAYVSAYNSDPISAFGGIIGFNKLINEETIKQILKNQFVEIIIGPQITNTALDMIKQHKKIKVLICGFLNHNYHAKIEFKSINNGLLIQESNINYCDQTEWTIVSKRQPTQLERKYALFGWKIVKFVKSNAIVYNHQFQTVSIGAGQTNRIESVKLANKKYFNNKNTLNLKNKKLIMASDAFFPFRDSIDEASYTNNISCIIQPGGSIRDSEIIQAANDHNICMIFTNIRNLKH